MTSLSGRGLILVVEDADDIRELALKVGWTLDPPR